MSQGEFALIQHYFNRQSTSSAEDPQLLLGIGDDGAVVQVPENHQLVQTIDTLIEDQHFPVGTAPWNIAYKSLAVNVSDLIAMAATPAYFVLSLTLPEVDEGFLEPFADGLFEAADEFSIRLIGGDTCKGPLSISIQANGFVPNNQYVTRSGAQVGDRIFVSGKLGAAAVGLACLQGRVDVAEQDQQICIDALNSPKPNLKLVALLRSFASSAIDLSDGLVGDLKHIIDQSGVGARIQKSNLPAYQWIAENDAYEFALAGGDDYQILFTVPEKHMTDMLTLSRQLEIELTDIGLITQKEFLMDDQAQVIDLSLFKGFDHFAK